MMYTTLGSSHLNVALRLVETDTPSVFGKDVRLGNALATDVALRDASENGMRSVVLRPDTPSDARRRISLLLNRAGLDGFRVRDDTGEAVLDPIPAYSRGGASRGVGVSSWNEWNAFHEPREKPMTLFQSLSRTLDAEELSSLVRIKHGIDLDRSQSGYADVRRPGREEEEKDTPGGVKIRSRL
jgi:hypothetical protein